MAPRELVNPYSKERITLLDSPDGHPGFAFEVQVPVDMVSPPAHIHRGEEERIEVLDGELTAVADGKQSVLRVGDSCVWRPGVAHTWWNSGGRPLHFRAEFSPAGNMQSFFETYCGLANEGRCDDRGQPPFLQVAASLSHWDMYLAGPPIAAQRLLMATLRPLARMRGYRPRYERFEQPQLDRSPKS